MERWSKLSASLPLNRYPDRRARNLCSEIAKFHSVSTENVFVANGSNEVLLTLLLAYGGTGATALSFEPTYAMYETISRMTSTEYVPLERADDFSIDIDGLDERIDEVSPDLIFLCLPNNPTGLIETDLVLDKLLERKDVLMVIDEAYGQFCEKSTVDRIATHENLVVVRTFSKIWSLAGMRIGYCIANQDVVEVLWNVVLPYHLDMSKALLASLSFEYVKEMEDRVATLIGERDRVYGELVKLNVTVWPSDTNFILFRPTDVDGSELWQRLIERGILIRDWSKWPRLDNCLRVTLGTKDENDEFIVAMKELL